MTLHHASAAPTTAADLVASLGGHGASARCPAHDDGQASLSVSEAHGRILVHCHAGCPQREVIASLRQLGLWPEPVKHQKRNGNGHGGAKTLVATYDYRDADGALLYQVCRYAPKTFRQRRPSGDGPDSWIDNMKGVTRTLYRLPQILAAVKAGRDAATAAGVAATTPTLYIVEGEKDVHALESLDLVATTNTGGAGKWSAGLSKIIVKSRFPRVVVIPDNDDGPGPRHAADVVRSLIASGYPANQVSTLTLPATSPTNTPIKDAADWVAAGGTRAELEAMAADSEATVVGEPASPEPSPSTAKPDTTPVDPKDPWGLAERYLADLHHHAERHTLLYLSGEFVVWTGTHYRTTEEACIRKAVYEWLALQSHWVKRGEDLSLAPVRPTPRVVSDTLDAIRARTVIPNTQREPSWIDSHGPNPLRLVPTLDGLLDVRSDAILPHTPRYYGRHVVPCRYQPGAEEPVQWLTFLHSIWQGDQERIDTLQEIMGYLLTPDTSQQKIFFLVGPRRSGKGTIARIIQSLVGQEHVTAPTLSALSTRFGLQPLLGKRLALVADARIDLQRADSQQLVERLLSISGEDPQSVDRKGLPAITESLRARLLIMTNELPKLRDSSCALPSRMIFLTMERSFFGQEEIGLGDRLLEELESIFAWSLIGLRRLIARGHFVQPGASSDVVQEFEDLASPVSAFLRDRCVVGPAHRVDRDDIYRAWTKWTEEQGWSSPGDRSSLGRQLRSVIPTIRDVRSQVGSTRMRHYKGLRLLGENEGGDAAV